VSIVNEAPAYEAKLALYSIDGVALHSKLKTDGDTRRNITFCQLSACMLD
jgi:hypothetical protein